MALRPNTILAIADARTWCHGDPADASADAKVEQSADSASERLETWTSRVYRARDLDEYYDGDGWSTVLYLRRFPVISVTTFTIDDAAVDATRYVLDRVQGRILLKLGFKYPNGQQNVHVVYRAGYETDAELPADALELARELCKRFYRLRTQGGGVFQTVNVGNSSFIVRDELPRDLKLAIEQLSDKRFG